MTELAAHGRAVLKYEVVISREQNGSWTATIASLGVRTGGTTDIEARSRAQALALRAIADASDKDQLAPDQIVFEVWLG